MGYCNICVPSLLLRYVTFYVYVTVYVTLRCAGSITVPRGVSVTHGRNLNVITTSLRRHDDRNLRCRLRARCNSLDVADRADLLRPPSDSMPLFVPRLKMDCGEIVRETVYMTDEDAGEYWRLSPDRYSALCLHSLRQVPVVWQFQKGRFGR